jgi:glyoxylase-like metal-dependent hydrolase (beta-lactamase superfamily II)
MEDQVLFVGDNVGLPIPSIYPGVKVEDFIATLETYRSLGLPRIVSSHYNEIEDDLIAANLRYLRKLLEDDTAEYDQGDYKFFNDWNKEMLARQVTES